MSYGWGDDTSSSWSGGNSWNWGSTYKAYDKSKSYAPSAKSAPKAPTNADMSKSYKLSSKVIKATLPQFDQELLDSLTADDIVVTPGQYDQVEEILTGAGAPFTMASNAKRVELDPKQVVLVNCPGNNLPVSYKRKKGVKALQAFVEDGGFLVTTDWALANVVTKAWKGMIGWNGRSTEGHDHVEIDLVAEGSPYTQGMGGGSLKPMWWLEPASYPIRLGSEDVDVLLGSQEMETKWGESPVAVKFTAGKGRVIHVTSHFKLQSGQTKYEAQATKTGTDFATMFAGMSAKNAKSIKGLGSVSFGAMESAYFSLRFLQNIFLQKIRDNKGISAHTALGLAGSAKNPKLLTADRKDLGKLGGKSLRKLPFSGKSNKKLI